MRSAIFIDRDGTINKDCPYCRNADQIDIFPDIFEPLRELSKFFYIIIVTNQSGISRGYFTEKDLQMMNVKIIREISGRGGRVDAVYYCPHLPEDNCNCRKPKTGLVERATKDFDIDLKNSFVIGNDEKDSGLARNLGIKSIIVRNNGRDEGDYNLEDFRGVDDIILNLWRSSDK